MYVYANIEISLFSFNNLWRKILKVIIIIISELLLFKVGQRPATAISTIVPQLSLEPYEIFDIVTVTLMNCNLHGFF